MSARRAVVVILVLGAVFGGAVLFAALALRLKSPGVAESSVLVFEVPAELEEGDPPPRSMDWLRASEPPLWRLARALRHAARDKRIAAMILHVDAVDWGWAKVAELNQAILEFRDAGKPVYASLSGGGEKEYVLASAADLVSAPPLAILQLDGLTASTLFLRGTFDKLDITPNIARAGAYKSGAESFTRREMSGEAREALQALLDDLYGGVLETMADMRGMPPDSVSRLLDRGPYGAAEAVQVGLIDTALHRADLDSMAVRAEGEARSTITLGRYLRGLPRSSASSRVALVVASGVIAEGRSHQSPGGGWVLGSQTLARALREAGEEKAVKAVVLRIDSPGGSAPASDEIWREVARLASRKPVVASLSDYAASGGYYVAVAADSIVAQPSSITGAIGVYGGKLNVLGLYRKLGLNVETLSRGQHAQMLSPYRDFTAEEARRFQAGLEVVYRTFTDRVASGRAMSVEDVERSAEGRVWSGRAARERALVDALGGLTRSIDMAKDMAGISADEEVGIDVYPKVPRPFLRRLLAELAGAGDEEETLASLRLPPAARAWLVAARFPAGVALALLPYSIEIR